MCLFPVRAMPQEVGKPKLDPEGTLQLPCGKCTECKAKRAVEWGLRARHEISEHDENCFLTLTYDDESLPSHLVVKSEFQKFMKRLRKHTKSKLRYMVSHEYGGRTGRPHHHAIIFGYNPSNQKYLFEAPSGEPLFTSNEIEKLWKHGFHSIGTANEKTAYYIASYSLKSTEHSILDPDSGEYIKVRDSMDVSKRPAIGLNYFNKNYNQLINSGEPIPRYYRKKLETLDVLALQEYEHIQATKLINKAARSSHETLAKYVITQQKESSSLGTFRAAPEKILERNFYKKHLEQKRDDYVTQLKRKTT